MQRARSFHMIFVHFLKLLIKPSFLENQNVNYKPTVKYVNHSMYT